MHAAHGGLHSLDLVKKILYPNHSGDWNLLDSLDLDDAKKMGMLLTQAASGGNMEVLQQVVAAIEVIPVPQKNRVVDYVSNAIIDQAHSPNSGRVLN